MTLENGPVNYYEEYRGYVIGTSESEGPENTFRSSAAVYYKYESSDYAFIIAGSDYKEPGQPVLALVGDAREYIDDLCCHELNQGIERPGTALPHIDLKGTDFFVDVTRFQLIEMYDSKNIIPFQKMLDYGDYYIINYNDAIKNVSDYPGKNDTEILMKQFVDLDPDGMAMKYGITVDEVKKKTDFDFMVDQKEFDLRVNQGKLPTIDINGHLFYVDIRMNKLRPKDDFSSSGIVFSDIQDYFSEEQNSYLIPYDAKRREFRELDFENLTSIPADLIAIKFPFQDVLDPIGWNRGLGWDIKENLKHIGVQGHFTAKVVDWKHTYLVDIIKDNLERMKTKEEKMDNKVEPKKGKGHKR